MKRLLTFACAFALLPLLAPPPVQAASASDYQCSFSWRSSDFSPFTGPDRAFYAGGSGACSPTADPRTINVSIDARGTAQPQGCSAETPMVITGTLTTTDQNGVALFDAAFTVAIGAHKAGPNGYGTIQLDGGNTGQLQYSTFGFADMVYNPCGTDSSYRPYNIDGRFVSGGQVGAEVNSGCAAAPAVSSAPTVPGSATITNTINGALWQVPDFGLDSEPIDSQTGDAAGSASDAAPPAAGDAMDAGGAPDPGACDNETSNKVVIAADARAVVCYLDRDNFPKSEVNEPSLAQIRGHNYVRVGGYSTCAGSSHATITRVYTVCAERLTPKTNLWHIMNPCRKILTKGFGYQGLGHDTRCTDKRDLERRTFVKLVLHDPAADNGKTHTKRVTTHGGFVDCGTPVS